MKYAYIKECRPLHSVAALCRALCVSESGYYAWLNSAPSPRQQTSIETVLWHS